MWTRDFVLLLIGVAIVSFALSFFWWYWLNRWYDRRRKPKKKVKLLVFDDPYKSIFEEAGISVRPHPTEDATKKHLLIEAKARKFFEAAQYSNTMHNKPIIHIYQESETLWYDYLSGITSLDGILEAYAILDVRLEEALLEIKERESQAL